MIKISELRIGNLVDMECDGKKFQTKIDVGDFMDINRGYKSVSGIQLTEDIILKLGIIHKTFYVVGAGICNKWQLDNFILLKNINGNFYCPLSSYNPVLEYVNQLQNLYFALTGSELDTSKLL